MPDSPQPAAPSLPRWLAYLLILGLYLTLRGYHSRDNDQAYRLPILLHRQSPALFAADPFVRAFDTFNPHKGSLTLLDWASRPFGLSAGLFALFALTFLTTVWAIDRLARAVWPELGPRVGLLTAALLLAAKAGNVGTNHLFEAMLLDRLMAYALAWSAFAVAIARPQRGFAAAPALIGLATLLHPSLGLQFALVLGTSWVAWFAPQQTRTFSAKALIAGLFGLGLALLPGLLLNVGESGRLLEGLPASEFRVLSVELQGPQHMLPHLWRLPQWLAWGCYLVLAGLAWVERDRLIESEAPKRRLAITLVVTLAGLGAAWFAVEVLRDLRITLFQPFRMATLTRGLALVLASGRAVALWRGGRAIDRARVVLVTIGLAGDWALVVATTFDAAAALPRRVRFDGAAPRTRRIPGLATAVLAGGLWFLARHDTESGHIPLLIGLLATPLASLRPRLAWNRRRTAFALGAAWALPIAALSLAPNVANGGAPKWQISLVERCRFRATAVDDIERLALWCRDHTPTDACFIGPPGPKTFRLWSLRAVAFNRAASPYHAAALGDWFQRFQDHVNDHSSPAEFVQTYQAGRHRLEQRYLALDDAEHAALARRQGAGFVIAAPPKTPIVSGPLELLHVEGCYAVYRVRPEAETIAASAGTG